MVSVTTSVKYQSDVTAHCGVETGPPSPGRGVNGVVVRSRRFVSVIEQTESSEETVHVRHVSKASNNFGERRVYCVFAVEGKTATIAITTTIILTE